MYRKFNRIVFSVTMTILVLIGGINIIIDPYFQYHFPFFGMKPVVHDERYQNPGIAKYFDYDSILIGSSMTQNFKVSQFNEKFNANTVKLTYSAIRTGNYNHMFDIAFASHDIKNVFTGLDMDPLLDTPGNYYFPLPEYLYDNNIFNDVKYVLNKSVLLHMSSKQVYQNYKNSVNDIDEAYVWGNDETIFSKERALASVTWDMKVVGERVDHPEYIENTKINLHQNITPYIKSHPNTTFYIFYPPYNLLWWNHRIYKGDLDAILNLLDYTSKALLAYDNVKLYGFQNVESLVSDLSKYMDYNHYNHDTNAQIIDWMKQDEYRLNRDNVDNYLMKLKNLVINFDYESFK